MNKHFGTKDDLKALSKALHDRGMYLMIDVVTNHMASNGSHEKVDYKKFTPFNDVSSLLEILVYKLTCVGIVLSPMVSD